MATNLPLSHVVSRFNNALYMVAELVPFADDQELSPVVRMACIEDWYTNYRLLIEFLLATPPGNCASPKDFIPGWTSASQSRGDLLKDYGMASEDFAHIGNLKGRQTPGSVSPSGLHPKARSILVIAEEFSQALTAQRHDFADMIRIGVETAKAAL
jgi:hypothetical protein